MADEGEVTPKSPSPRKRVKRVKEVQPYILEPLPEDPEPSEEELAARLIGADPALHDALKMMARIEWRIARAKEDPNAFRVAFVTHINHWPQGTGSYDAYRESALWKRIRHQCLSTYGNRCACCGGTARQVHHRDYRLRVLMGDDPRALVPICKACHDKVHYDESGKKREVWQDCEAVLAELM